MHIGVGWEARKTPVDGDVFFLDFSFYRTSQAQSEKTSSRGLEIAPGGVTLEVESLPNHEKKSHGKCHDRTCE
jgi:hypothetical protein